MRQRAQSPCRRRESRPPSWAWAARPVGQPAVAAGHRLGVLGDVFDRGGMNPDPIGVYFMLSGIKGKLTWIRGNHEQYLAE